MAIAQLVVKLGHKLREDSNQRVRQPLAELRVACGDDLQRAAVESLTDVIKDELNVKAVSVVDDLAELVSYSYKPNLKTLGPKYGKLLGAIRKQLPEIDAAVLAPLRSGESVVVEFGGEPVTLGPDDVLVSTKQAADWASGDEAGIQVALSLQISPALKREGMRNDFVRQIQQLRKSNDLQIEDRIKIYWNKDSEEDDDSEFRLAIEEWTEYILNETLADSIENTMDHGQTEPKIATGRVGEILIKQFIVKVD
jgi:isoleucyl-tRNA synthetase